MIRGFEARDQERVLDIWLTANLQAHSFIPAHYWRGQLENVRPALFQAEVYVWEEGGDLLGFLGLEGDHIAGIFVSPEAQSRGVGLQLLDRAKANRDRLTLCVYQKNVRVAAFYRREGFTVLEERTDSPSGEGEVLMCWVRSDREEPLC